ncbi:unnamed protein product [Mesocestoides corti]|uniref:Uncharacterized protein n=1 Tax=Mesocestoides corti TaxID=53468 RepID=A0A0R3URP8_MESCO|nr:unnamed protein product [Mesocestoides corti]
MTHPGYPLVNSDWLSQGCSAAIGPDEFSCSPDRDHERTMLQKRIAIGGSMRNPAWSEETGEGV